MPPAGPDRQDVSVVMATCNGAAFVAEQLRSLATQTVLPAELVVSDDASTDGTVDIVRRFASRAPFPVIVRQNDQRLGYGENFLRAALLATGAYVAFSDQDDVWHPDKIAVSVRQLVATGADLFVHTASLIDDRGRPVGRFRQGIRRRVVHEALELPPWSVFYGCTMTFRRRLLTLVDVERRGPHTFEHQGRLSHDLWVYFLATTLGRVVVDPRPLLRYRRHGGNATPGVSVRGVRARLRTWGVPAHPGLPRAAAAEQRAVLLAELGCSSPDPTTGGAAARGVAFWHSVGTTERRRLAMYARPRMGARLTAWIRLAGAGAYRSSGGGLGRALMAKDALVGVLSLGSGRRWATQGYPPGIE